MPEKPEKLPDPFVITAFHIHPAFLKNAELVCAFDNNRLNIIQLKRGPTKAPAVAEAPAEPSPEVEADTAVVASLAVPETKTIASEKLVENFDDALVVLRHMLEKAENKPVGGLQLDSLEVNLAVTAEGKLSFFGSGGSLSGTTSLTLTFKRRDGSKN
jgi:hypothetical protein